MKEFVLRGRGPNTMSRESLDALSTFLTDNPDAPLLIRGEGEVFSAGLDIDALVTGNPALITATLEALAERLFLHPAPTVAAINGHAIAGGCLLAQACDLRIADKNPTIKIGMPGVALGINYPPTLLRILRYRLPSQTIDRILLGAANHDPAAALTAGLVDELAQDVLAVAQLRLEQLAAHPRPAYAETKRALRAEAIRVSPAERQRFEEIFANHWAGASLQRHRRDKA